jgi:hypothetical protein
VQLTSTDFEATQSASAPVAAQPAPFVFIVHVTRTVNDGPANTVHILREHDECGAHHLAREAFPDATCIRVQSSDTLARLRRLSPVEADALARFHAAEQGSVQ